MNVLFQIKYVDCRYNTMKRTNLNTTVVRRHEDCQHVMLSWCFTQRRNVSRVLSTHFEQYKTEQYDLHEARIYYSLLYYTAFT